MVFSSVHTILHVVLALIGDPLHLAIATGQTDAVCKVKGSNLYNERAVLVQCGVH
jgi:hypothetical protein